MDPVTLAGVFETIRQLVLIHTNEAASNRYGGRLSSIAGSELLEKVDNVVPHGVPANAKLVGDLEVIHSLSYQLQDLRLARARRNAGQALCELFRDIGGIGRLALVNFANRL